MRDAVAEIDDVQRRIDAVLRFADVPSAPCGPGLMGIEHRLTQLYAELEQARTRATPELKQRREFTAVGANVSGSRGGSQGLPGLKAGPAADVEVLVDLRMPSIPTSLVRLFALDGTALVSVRVLNRGSTSRKLCVSTCVEGFSAKALETVVCVSGEQQVVDLFPTFFPAHLADLDEFCVASVSVEVSDLEQGATLVKRTVPIRLLARQTAVLYQLDPQTGQYRDLRHTLGAWVTPNAKAVLELLRTAADFSSLRAMSGYQVDEAGVLEHVRAIFEALKAAKIVYVNSVDAFGGVDGQFLQRVRTPSESLACKSANCIDGTVLMASLLEATGIEAGIVLVPGHAYLGWLKCKPGPTDPGSIAAELAEPEQHPAAWGCIETTLVASASFDAARQHAEQASERFRRANLLTILPISGLRRRNVTPLE